jgi:hypothetical protein
MAILYPDIDVINSSRVQPEPGEIHILNFLHEKLDDNYEVFFQPFLNGDRPDIIVMRKGFGVIVIEVKDWHLNNYYLDAQRKWRVRHNNSFIKSPIDQALRYKENLYNLHIESLLEKKIKNFKYWSLVCCFVYFHNASSHIIDEFLIKPYSDDEKYCSFLKWNVDIFGNDTLNIDALTTVLKKRKIIGSTQNMLFNEDLYESFKRYFKPTFHRWEDGVEMKFTKEQERLAKSSSSIEQRVRGVVGSGKTTVLGTRAVNAHRRHQNRVLILCYNITLKNYIHDRVSRVRQDFSWEYFYINNYHNFISSEMNNHGIDFNLPKNFDDFTQAEKNKFFESYFSNTDLFKDCKDRLEKYDTILIDEIQDYQRSWMDMIKLNFLNSGGEYVIWGDEKQNIYNNELEQKDLKTNVRGNPSLLKDSFRAVKQLKDLAVQFQKRNFIEKYTIDNFNELTQLSLNFDEQCTIRYIYLEGKQSIDITSLYKLIADYSIKLNEPPNNITLLGFRVDVLREFDCYYRYKKHERTNAMFETQEVWYKLFLQTFKEQNVIKQGIDLISVNDNEEDNMNKIAVLLALRDLVRSTNDNSFKDALSIHFDRYGVKRDVFESWYICNELADLLNTNKHYSLRHLESKYPKYRQLTKSLKTVRDNKKFHFWYDRGTIKLSTIHSFKGWEASTLFLILEEQFENTDFHSSFEELIYTAITRSKSNLIIVNYGNSTHHVQMNELLAEFNQALTM